MTTTNDQLVSVLNDLIQINNDRVVGYEKAIQEAKDLDVDLKTLFGKFADQSRKFTAELTNKVTELGGEPDTGTTNSGKIYRVWMDVKATFSGHTRQAVLENCEFGEDAAQKAYKMALASDADIDTETRQLITDQQSKLKEGHDTIKKLRDDHKAVNN